MLERTDPKKGEFSPTGVMTADCPRKFFLSKILGLRPKAPASALAYGSAIHSAVETFYKRKPAGLTLEELTVECVNAFVKEWNLAQAPGDMKRNLEVGILTVNAYVRNYFHEPEQFELQDIEENQWFPMPNGTMLLVKPDRVLKMENLIIVADTKTTSMALTDWYFRQFETSFQLTMYMYVMRELFGRADYALVDAIKVPHNPKSKTDQFARQSFMRTDLQYTEALNTYTKITNFIMNILRSSEDTMELMDMFYCNHNKCNEYGGCKYLPVCKYGLGHPAVAVDFTQN